MPIICVLAPKGGAGGSFVACNMAVGLARHAPCLLVDVHPEGGDADLLLGMPPSASWVDLVSMMKEAGGDRILQAVARHPSGLNVLIATGGPAQEVDSDDVLRLVTGLEGEFPWVILDCATGPAELVDRIFSICSFVALVTTPDPAALRRTARMSARLPPGLHGRVGVVINQSRREHPLAVPEIGKALGLPVLAVVPADPAQAERQAFHGEPAIADSGTTMGRALVGLVETLRRAGPAIEARPKGRPGPADRPGRELGTASLERRLDQGHESPTSRGEPIRGC